MPIEYIKGDEPQGRVSKELIDVVRQDVIDAALADIKDGATGNEYVTMLLNSAVHLLAKTCHIIMLTKTAETEEDAVKLVISFIEPRLMDTANTVRKEKNRERK